MSNVFSRQDLVAKYGDVSFEYLCIKTVIMTNPEGAVAFISGRVYPFCIENTGENNFKTNMIVTTDEQNEEHFWDPRNPLFLEHFYLINPKSIQDEPDFSSIIIR